MTTSGEDEEDRAAMDAARWLIALDDNPDDVALRARFESWLNASPANAAAWADTADVYDMMAKTPPVHAEHWMPYRDARQTSTPIVVAGGESPHVSAQRSKSRSTPRRRLIVGVVAAGMAACLALAILPIGPLSVRADYVTTTAELRSLRLDDGSAVHLGPRSALDVAFTAGERRVRMLKGEAFFEVAHDPSRPFRVVARDAEATALGTAFDVHVQEEGTEVAVRDGTVRVDATGPSALGSKRLGAGEWVRIATSGRVERGAVPPDDVAPWRQGQIVARDQRIADVADELRRYYGGIIVITNQSFGRQRVTGVYNLQDPAAALQAIAGAHGGSVHRISPWLLIVSGG